MEQRECGGAQVPLNDTREAAEFLHETEELQRIVVRCLLIVLARHLEEEGLMVGAVWHECFRLIRIRALLPYRFLRSEGVALWFQLLVERLNQYLLVKNVTFQQRDSFIDFTAHVEVTS